MSGKSDAKKLTWYALRCCKFLDEVSELKQRIKELEAQAPKVVRPALNDGGDDCPECEFRSLYRLWNFCPQCGAKLNWEHEV